MNQRLKLALKGDWSRHWQADDGSWRYAWPGQIAGSPTPPQTGLAELVNELHDSLGLPVAGIYVMGIVSLLYSMALLSGLVIHLPKLLGDLFALRPGLRGSARHLRADHRRPWL